VDDAMLEAVVKRLEAADDKTRRDVAEIQQQFDTLIEIMIAFGTLRPGHAELIEKLRKRIDEARKISVELAQDEDKYAIQGEPIDCDSRLELCKARCCAFNVVLSQRDLQEGQLMWEIDLPYRLARGNDGYCVHLARDDAGCQRYEHRPATCRKYSCKNDRRVWLDFEARIPAPFQPTLVPIQRLMLKRKP
jgi:Fe-S-cluster containining protein